MSSIFRNIQTHDHTGSPNGAVLTDTAIIARNAQYLKAKDAAGTGTVNLIKANASNALELGAATSVNGGSLEILAGAAGDPKVVFDINGADKFYIGVDDSDDDKLVIGSGAAVGTTPAIVATNGNIVTHPSKPIFIGANAVAQDVTGDTTAFPLNFSTEIMDVGNNYASSTFTAPVTGVYFVSFSSPAAGVTASYVIYNMQVVASNRTINLTYFNGAALTVSSLQLWSASTLIDMDAGDTLQTKVAIGSSTKAIDFNAGYHCSICLIS